MFKFFTSTLGIFLIAISSLANTSVLCEGDSNQLSFSQSLQLRNSDEFRLVTWNAHKLADSKFISDLVKISQDVDFIAIQEAMHSDEYQTEFLKNFSFFFSFHKSFCDQHKQATGVMSMSRFQLEINKTLVSPDTEPLTNTPKVSGYSTLTFNGTLIHIINTHALNFNTGSKFEKHINSIAEFIKTLQGPVLWIGDFNTWSDSRVKYLMQKTQTLGLTHLNPANDNRSQKLDHIFSRGLDIVKTELLSQYKTSDHLPVEAVFKKK